MRRALHAFFWTSAFLTAVPVPRATHGRPAHMGWVAFWFPVVGAGLGLVAGGLLAAGTAVGYAPLGAWAAVAALALLTRGLHLDGLADAFDGLWGGATAEERLDIMRRPGVGAFGAAALVIVLSAEGLILWEVAKALEARAASGPVLAGVLVVAASIPAVSRWAVVVSAAASSYARPGGTAAPFFSSWRFRHALVSGVLPLLALALLCGPVGGALMLAPPVAGALAWSALCRRRIGGMTGDTLGAAGELCELAVGLAWLAWLETPGAGFLALLWEA